MVLKDWGVRCDIDLRSIGESPRLTDRLSGQDWVRWVNVPFFDTDISSKPLTPSVQVQNYLVGSYLTMLSSRTAVTACIANASAATSEECVLFHCAAGMDRTGMLSMLLLGCAGVGRDQIACDYCLSFSPIDAIERSLERERALGYVEVGDPQDDYAAFILSARLQAILAVYDTIIEHHRTIPDFLISCGVTGEEVEAVRSHLLDP
jgi:protein-tyrosine phosphatase